MAAGMVSTTERYSPNIFFLSIVTPARNSLVPVQGGLGLHQHSQGLRGEGCFVTDERSRGIHILFGEVTRFSVVLQRGPAS